LATSARGLSAAHLAIPPLRVAGSMMLPIRAPKQPAGRALRARVARKHLSFRTQIQSRVVIVPHDSFYLATCRISVLTTNRVGAIDSHARPAIGLAK
jgi:hypothetical protein